MGFIGFEEDYDKYKKDTKQTSNIRGTGNKISADTIPDLSDEDLKILNQTRCRKDPLTVYMQSDISFYDNFYNEEVEDENNFIDKELLEEAKSIRRIYKNYFQFNYAQKIRDAYLDALVDKYGGEELFQTYLKSGLVKDWIPPRPIYSKNSPDYKLYLQGKFNLNQGEFNDDLLEEIMGMFREELGDEEDIQNIKPVGSVLTNPMALQASGLQGESNIFDSPIHRSKNSQFGQVDSNDILELQKTMRSWLEPDKPQPESVNKFNGKLFASTEDELQKDYFTKPIIDNGGLAKAMESGEYIPDETIDPNEMVIDPVSNRPMTYSDYQNREFVRFMAQAGWNELRLMRHMGVGSNYEIRLMEQKRRNRKRAKKKAQSFMDDIIGDVSEISSIDDLNNLLFDD